MSIAGKLIDTASKAERRQLLPDSVSQQPCLMIIAPSRKQRASRTDNRVSRAEG